MFPSKPYSHFGWFLLGSVRSLTTSFHLHTRTFTNLRSPSLYGNEVRKNDERVTVPGEASEWRERDETRQTEGQEETNKRRMEMANLSLENRLLTINSPFHITYHLYLYLRFIFCILFSINLISSENKSLIKSIKVLIPSF